MKVPIRMLGIAISVFWVLLITTVILAAYSMTDLKFNIDEPELSFDQEGQLNFNLPLIIDNDGYYNLKELNITTLFSSTEGLELSRAHTLVPIIPSGKITKINHSVSLNIEEIYQTGEKYLFEDNDLQVSLSVGLNFAEVLPSKISTNFSFPWGAPFSNFDLCQPSVNMFNLTHSIISVPISYDNHAFYDVLGSIDVELYDNENSLLSEIQELISTSQQSSYNENIELLLPNSIPLDNIQDGYFNISFSTLIFEYGPMVIHYDGTK